MPRKQKDETAVVAYKAFKRDFTCRDHKFEVGKTYAVDGPVALCENGFHACENPLDVLDYYDLYGSRFARVTLTGAIDRETSGQKICGGSITIDAELSLPDWIKASVNWLIAAAKSGDRVQAASGDYSKLAASGNSSQLAASGDSSKLAASGYSSKLAASGNSSQLAASGDYSKLAASGYSSKLAASGYSSKLAASGNSSQLAASGDYSKLAASGYSSQLAASGYSSKLAASGNSSQLAASGNSSQLAASGYSSKLAASGNSSQLEVTGSNGVAVAAARGCRVKAVTGTWVALPEFDNNGKCIGGACGFVGQDGIPADVWLIAKGGKLVEKPA